MEPQEKYYCYGSKETKRKNCFEIVAIILFTIFMFVIGLMVGAEISATILLAISSVIVFTTIIGILLILTGILIFCNKKRIKNYE